MHFYGLLTLLNFLIGIEMATPNLEMGNLPPPSPHPPAPRFQWECLATPQYYCLCSSYLLGSI